MEKNNELNIISIIKRNDEWGTSYIFPLPRFNKNSTHKKIYLILFQESLFHDRKEKLNRRINIKRNGQWGTGLPAWPLAPVSL